MSRGYVRADAAHTPGPWQTDAGAPDPDEAHDRWVDLEDLIPSDWEPNE